MSILYEKSAHLVRIIYDKRIFGPPVLAPEQHFADAQRFAALWPALREEALAVAAQMHGVPRFHELMPEQAKISANDQRDWRMLVLKAYGVTIPANLNRCPTLAGLLATSPEVLSATLSFLAPYKHIPRHRGPFRGITRFYLGLSVPVDANGRPETVLAIADIEHRIANGEYLLWDDTYPHEVWNRSDRVRIALLLDVRRRGMPWDMALLSRLLIAAIAFSVRLRKALRQVKF